MNDETREKARLTYEGEIRRALEEYKARVTLAQNIYREATLPDLSFVTGLPLTEPVKAQVLAEGEQAIKLKCLLCEWTGTAAETGFGKDDYYCPTCQTESLTEVYDSPDSPPKRTPRSTKRASKKA